MSEISLIKNSILKSLTQYKSSLNVLFVLTLVVFSAGILGSNTAHAADGWHLIGSGAVSDGQAYNTSLALDASSTPYVLYRDSTVGFGATVKKFNGATWETVGAKNLSGGNAYGVAIALDSNDVPYVVYGNSVMGGKATVKKFNGATWETVGTEGFSGGNADYVSIVIGSDNFPYVVYVDSSKGSRTTVKKFNGATWETVGTEGFSAGDMNYTAITLDSNNVPYVMYADLNSNGNRAVVQKFNGATWETVGTEGFLGGDVHSLSIVTDAGDIPYIAYSDYDAGQNTFVRKFNGTTWDTLGGGAVSSGLTANASLAFNLDNTLHVAYLFEDRVGSGVTDYLTVKRFDSENDTWITIGDVGSLADAANYISFAINANGVPYVSYTENTFTTVVKYGPIPDTSAPVVTTFTPSDNATNIAIDTDLSITFDEVVDATSGTITLKKKSDDSTVETFAVASAITGSGTETITFNPSADLDTDTEYYVLIDAGTFADADSNSFAGIASTTIWSFTTLDTISPTVQSFSPADDATGVAVNANLSVTFSEAVFAESGKFFTLKKSTDGTVIETFDVGSDIAGSGTHTITLNPTADLIAGAEYYLEIDLGALVDIGGNQFAGIAGSSTWNFTVVVAENPNPNPNPDPGQPSSGSSGGGGSKRLGCGDEKASNYKANVTHRQSRCEYDTEDKDDDKVADPKVDQAGDKTKDTKGNKSVISSQVENIIKNNRQLFVDASTAGIKLPGYICTLLGLQACIETIVTTPSADIQVRDLYSGLEGEDVRMLQQRLNASGFPLAATGAGSPGNETIYFVDRTENALAKYQLANGIVPFVGYFGPITRTQMKGAGLTGLWW